MRPSSIARPATSSTTEPANSKPTLEPLPSLEAKTITIETQWKKALQKIEEKKAKLLAENKIAELQKFETLAYQCHITQPENHVIKNRKAWDLLLQRMATQNATSLFPDINFQTSMIAAVFTGEKTFAEKLYLIDSHTFEKTAHGQKLVIIYREQFAPKGSTISSIMMQPYHLKIFPTFAGPVEFRKGQ